MSGTIVLRYEVSCQLPEDFAWKVFCTCECTCDWGPPVSRDRFQLHQGWVVTQFLLCRSVWHNLPSLLHKEGNLLPVPYTVAASYCSMLVQVIMDHRPFNHTRVRSFLLNRGDPMRHQDNTNRSAIEKLLFNLYTCFNGVLAELLLLLWSRLVPGGHRGWLISQACRVTVTMVWANQRREAGHHRGWFVL